MVQSFSVYRSALVVLTGVFLLSMVLFRVSFSGNAVAISASPSAGVPLFISFFTLFVVGLAVIGLRAKRFLSQEEENHSVRSVRGN